MSDRYIGKIKCPHCSTAFPVIQHKSYGAAVAKLWNTVPKFHRAFLTWWYSRQVTDKTKEWYTKVEIHKLFCEESGHTINLNNFGDRLSGIKGMKYSILDIRKGMKSNNNNVSVDQYRLDTVKITKLMNHDWNIVKTLEERNN